MQDFDNEDVQDQVVAQADDEDFDDEDEDFDEEDEYDDDDQEDDLDEVALLEEVAQTEQAHKDAIAEYAQVIEANKQRQIAAIKQAAEDGATVADIAKVYPRKFVVEVLQPAPAVA